ncbi:hypothetical protein ACOSQ2_028979 [Xanthoceras sorbifolium]
MLGEFLALRECLILAKSLSLSLSVAEVDASNVASVINSSVPSYGDASFVIDDIKALCKEVGDCCCMAIPRSGNRLAHILASTAFSSGVEQSSSHVAKDSTLLQRRQRKVRKSGGKGLVLRNEKKKFRVFFPFI